MRILELLRKIQRGAVSNRADMDFEGGDTLSYFLLRRLPYRERQHMCWRSYRFQDRSTTQMSSSAKREIPAEGVTAIAAPRGDIPQD